jgi:hypothetical protein
MYGSWNRRKKILSKLLPILLLSLACNGLSRVTVVPGGVMEPNSTLDAAWTDSGDNPLPDRPTPERWTADECNAIRFVKHEFTIDQQFTTSLTTYCSSPLIVTNIDDTIVVDINVRTVDLPDGTSKWIGCIPTKPGETCEFTSFYSDDTQTGFDAICIERLAVYFAVDECAWIGREKAYEQIALDVNPPCKK